MIYSSYSTILGASLIGVVSSHICMWAPAQRSPINLSGPGQKQCRLTDGPCGGEAAGEILTKLDGGNEFSVLFQQNLNHFSVYQPGQLVADFAEVANPTEEDFYPLSDLHDYNAMNEITQTNFTLDITVPNIDCEHCVLRMRYIPNNELEPSAFYQCADVSVSKTAGERPEEKTTAAPSSSSKKNDNYASDCCSPKQFQMQGYESGSWRAPTQLAFFFDAVSLMFRADSNSGTGTTIYDGQFQMYSNYSNGNEYYYNVITDECVIYGLDVWTDWCYGAVNDQVYTSSVKVGHETADVWQVPGNVFSWSSTHEGCLPVSRNRFDTGETTMYFNVVEGAPSPDVFVPPASCLEQEAKMAASNQKPRRAPEHLRQVKHTTPALSK